MAKIPRGRSDKEMLAGMAEEASLDDSFMQAEAKDAARAREKKKRQPEPLPVQSLGLSSLPPAFCDQLDKEICKLKLELAWGGEKNVSFQIERKGDSIVLRPKLKK